MTDGKMLKNTCKNFECRQENMQFKLQTREKKSKSSNSG